MNTAIVSSKELFDKDKNPTLCLSAKRYTKNCVNCNVFQRARYKSVMAKLTGEELAKMGYFHDTYVPVKKRTKWKQIRLPIDKAIARLECKPVITENQLKILRKRDELLDKKEELRKTIQEINDVLNIEISDDIDARIDEMLRR